MQIQPIIGTYNINNNHKYKKRNISFNAHPDFYGYNSTISCYFRRGAVVLACAKAYAEIENIFKKVFNTDKDKQKQVLIIGIGNSQEPFSYLSSIKGILQERLLKNNVDLYTVDLQSRPEYKELKKSAFCDLYEYEKIPEYASKSIVKDNYSKWLGIKDNIEDMNPIEKYIYEYQKQKESQKPQKLYDRVNDEVFEFLNSTYNNPQKSKWDSRIQEVIKDYPDEKFNVISANNVLPYIVVEKDILQTIEHIARTLKTGGYYITDPYEPPQFIKESGVLNNFKQINNGIYEKI